MSFTLYFIHILFISNEFQKFWMSSDCSNRCTKNEHKWAKSQADRPLLGRPAWHLQKHGPGFDPVTMRHTHKALSPGLALVQLDTLKDFNIHPKIHKTAQDQIYFGNPLPWRRHKSRAESRQNQRPRWARGRPAGLAHATTNRSQLPTDSRR